jgi:hypothetical protein
MKFCYTYIFNPARSIANSIPFCDTTILSTEAYRVTDEQTTHPTLSATMPEIGTQHFVFSYWTVCEHVLLLVAHSNAGTLIEIQYPTNYVPLQFLYESTANDKHHMRLFHFLLHVIQQDITTRLTSDTTITSSCTSY